MSFARSMPCFCLQQTSAQPGQTLFVYSSMSGESQVRSSLSCRAMVSFVSGMECGPSGDKRVQGQGRHDEEACWAEAARTGYSRTARVHEEKRTNVREYECTRGSREANQCRGPSDPVHSYLRTLVRRWSLDDKLHEARDLGHFESGGHGDRPGAASDGPVDNLGDRDALLPLSTDVLGQDLQRKAPRPL